MPKNNSGVMSKINNYIKSRREQLAENPLFDKYDKMRVEDLIACYKDNTCGESEKKFILETIYLKVFFYFPSFLSKKRYRMNVMLYDEALQNISLHILDAINRFDPSRGFPFVAYAYGDITAAMTQTFQEYNTIRLPQGSKASKAKAFFKEEDSPAKEEEHNDDCEIPVDNFVLNPDIGMTAAVDNPDKAINSDISTDVVLSSQTIMFTDADSMVVVNYDNDLHNKQVKEWLEEALSEESGVLTDDERQVVILHNGLFDHEPMVYDDIAAMRREAGKGSSRSRISQIHTRAVEKLRNWFEEMEVDG
ncbi:hypothetical protein B5F76_08285 [Desulfovibrio sp. An276]|nr:hypothetical protein B5F76_08285 [Desulfovibrio sp. An276]